VFKNKVLFDVFFAKQLFLIFFASVEFYTKTGGNFLNKCGFPPGKCEVSEFNIFFAIQHGTCFVCKPRCPHKGPVPFFSPCPNKTSVALKEWSKWKSIPFLSEN